MVASSSNLSGVLVGWDIAVEMALWWKELRTGAGRGGFLMETIDMD